MFFNNHVSTRSILTNNENATVRRSKSNGENGTKKAFNENSVKTPLCKDGSKSVQTTQRRRRAFGDISNRKAAGAAGGGKGTVLKQKAFNDATQGLLKPGNSKVLLPQSSNKNRIAQVTFSKTPSIQLKSAASKRESSTEYDGVFGVTTRWSNELSGESRSLFDLVPEDELNLVSDFRDEMMERRKKESLERDRMELERCEEKLLKQLNNFHQVNEKDIEEMGTMAATCGIYGEEDEELDLWNQTLPWEEEDEI